MFFNVMPVIAAIGAVVIVVVFLVMRGMERKAQYSGLDLEKFNRFVEDIQRENADDGRNLIWRILLEI